MDYRPDDIDSEFEELLWEHERRRRRQRVLAVIAAIVVTTMVLLTVLSSVVRAVRDRRPEPTQPSGVRALVVEPLSTPDS